MRILAFGDSITYGAWDTQGGWVERMKTRAHTTTVTSKGMQKYQVINLGIGGDTSRGLLKRMRHEIDARVAAGWPLTITIAIGTNDSRTKDGIVEVPLDEFEANLQQIVEIAREYTANVFLVGLPPLGVAQLDFKAQRYTDADIHSYDVVVQRVAAAYTVVYIPIRPLFEASPVPLFAFDTLHPNDDGHVAIADAVLQAFHTSGITIQ